MSFRQALRAINQGGLIHACLLMLTGLCVSCHVIATFKLDMCGGHFWLMNERTIRGMALIRFMAANLWFPVLYGLLMFSGVMYLQARGYAKWTYWVYASVLSVPCFYYFSVCAYIYGKFGSYILVPG